MYVLTPCRYRRGGLPELGLSSFVRPRRLADQLCKIVHCVAGRCGDELGDRGSGAHDRQRRMMLGGGMLTA